MSSSSSFTTSISSSEVNSSTRRPWKYNLGTFSPLGSVTTFVIISCDLVYQGVVLLQGYTPTLGISGLLGETYFQKSLVRFIRKLLTGTRHDEWLPNQYISLKINVDSG
ncbi:hypothetical protein IV203_028887 [Nitzschia inconspicua]|uniref:Uncharacterized protein n=1 Tax=Nitzschia inconspicua TaxID=303405 RepID=A0A9K3LQ51_9STRA|nr:hypothetical protein IV203_028887 [Nitzschia inconspicua]